MLFNLVPSHSPPEIHFLNNWLISEATCKWYKVRLSRLWCCCTVSMFMLNFNRRCVILYANITWNKFSLCSAQNEFTFPRQPGENVISSQPKPICTRMNDVLAELTDDETSDPLLYASFISFDTMLTDWTAGTLLGWKIITSMQISRRVDNTLSEHGVMMPHSWSINNLWKWLISDVLTLLAIKQSAEATLSSPPLHKRQGEMAPLRHKWPVGNESIWIHWSAWTESKKYD